MARRIDGELGLRRGEGEEEGAWRFAGEAAVSM